MKDTKERILETALGLFAREGYRAVSVSRIAGALGMTKGALYKHFGSKRDIFDEIVAKMVEIDLERAQNYAVPETDWAADPAAYAATRLDDLRAFTLAQYQFWTADPFGAAFRKMLALEQYCDPAMGALYQSCLVSGPTAYLTDLFGALIAGGVCRAGDPAQMAVTFFAPLFLLIQMSDADGGCPQAERLLDAHLTHFLNEWTAEPKKGEAEHVQ